MRSLCLFFSVASLLIVDPLYSSELPPTQFDRASWIWYSSGGDVPLRSLTAGVGHFRGRLAIPGDCPIRHAELIATADNLMAVYLNGEPLGETPVNNSVWKQPRRWDLTEHVAAGENVLAVEAVNTVNGPAGLIAKLTVILTDGRRLELVTGSEWMATEIEHPGWQQADFDDTHWNDASVMAIHGAAPWGVVRAPNRFFPVGTPVGKVHAAGTQARAEAAKARKVLPVETRDAPSDYAWPEAVVFLAEDCSLHRPPTKNGTAADSLSVTVFNQRKSKAFPEHDLPSPMQVARRLMLLKPARPGVRPRVLLDAGDGALGSPSVSFDGRSIYVSMARLGDPFYHVYRIGAEGGPVEQLTDGPFHDIDPAELPDGRIVFTSTRIGTFEEYHSPPSRSLFVMRGDGREIRPLTHTLIFDNEPEVLADGRILFIRSDNFFDRGKVETRLHAIHPDGTLGYTEFGLDLGPEYGRRLRAFYCGSPAPLPDGGLAFVSSPGISIGRLGAPHGALAHYRIDAGDVAAMPCGRLLCTTPSRIPVEIATAEGVSRTIQDVRYDKIGVFDPGSESAELTPLYESPRESIHSPLYLGPRSRPPRLAEQVDLATADDTQATGVLYCQDVFATKNTTAGWPHVRAIRVLAGRGLTMRSSHSYIVHAGNETTELGTVPLAPDGSFAIEVPANTPLALQAVDADGRAELNEMSWIYVKPGERRGCVGCHAHRQSAPSCTATLPIAMRARPLRLLGGGDPHRFRGNNAAVTGLMNLQLDRYREIAGLNRQAADDGALAGGLDQIDALVARLAASDAAVRQAAATRLSVFRDPAAADPLAARLDDPSREVRVAAAVALSACGTRASVAPLLDAADDPDLLVAWAAQMALEHLLGDRPAAGSWRPWFESTTWERIEAERIEQLSSSDRDRIRRAATALAHTGSAAARQPLRELVRRLVEVNPLPAWRASGRQGDAARFNALSEANPRTLQAAIRALGYLGDRQATPLLREVLATCHDPQSGNLFAAEAAVEALARIGTREAEAALIDAFDELGDYPEYARWYGDHAALIACHASPVHYRIVEALDRFESGEGAPLVGPLLCSLPIDPDRALFPDNDDCETLVGRVIRRSGKGEAVVETCLALLGDRQAAKDPTIEAALGQIHRCWAGEPSIENRAAQILSLVCRDRRHEPRIRAALLRYRATDHQIARVFDTGIPVVDALPRKNWVCFYLARTLGNLGDRASVAALIRALEEEPAEAASGRPDPLGPGVLFLHDEVTPCWRAAVAWALGRIADRRAVPVLLEVVGDLDNAPDTRMEAVRALRRIADPATLEPLRLLAADYPEISTRRALIEACEALPE